jgi:hypothetical protein
MFTTRVPPTRVFITTQPQCSGVASPMIVASLPNEGLRIAASGSSGAAIPD